MANKKFGKKSVASNDFLEPKAVTGLTATDVGTSRPYLLTANTTSAASAANTGGAVNLSWTLPADSPAATSYTITTTPSTYTVTTGNANTSYTFQGLASGTAYTFTVSGTNAAGTAAGTTSSSTTATTVPATPAAPTATAGVNQDTVSWTAPATGGKAISGYIWASSDNKTNATGGTPGGGSTALTSVTVSQEGSTAQTYTVYAINANGNSLTSAASGSVTTLPPFFPPYFPPYFPPFFPPYFPAAFTPPFFPPSFGPTFGKPKCCCIGENTMITTPEGPVMAKDISIGDKVLTVSPENLVLDENEMYTFTLTDGKVNLVETIVTEAARSEEKAIYFNDDMTAVYSINQPMFIKSESGLTSISAADIVVGSVLIAVNSDGTLTETEIESISNADESVTVYTIRTGPQRWFIAGGHLVIS